MPEIERPITDQPPPNSDALLFGRYEVGKLLGCGAFAKVYHARDARAGNRSVALKVINKKKLLASNAGLAANIKREIAIMKRLRHPNIVRLHDVAATRSRIYVVMEFVKGGELFAKVARGRFAEDLARRHFRQLVSAVGFCHSRGVFHRDLKPENLLLDERGDLKVSDFGLSAVAADQLRADGLLHTLCGTPAYVAPEILEKRGYDGARVDVWSCGVVLFVLTAGYLPFSDPNLMALYKKIYKGEFRCPKWMSPELKRFLSRLLDVNPETRITIDEIARDPWFNKGGYEAEAIDFYGDEEFEKLDEEKPVGELNAFDIISFSSGLDLSGLFVTARDSTAAEEAPRLVAEESPEIVVGRIEAFAEAEKLRVKRRREFGVELEGLNGGLAMAVDVYRLAEGFVVVEAKRRGGDAEIYDEVWRNKLRPLLEASSEFSDSEASCSSIASVDF